MRELYNGARLELFSLLCLFVFLTLLYASTQAKFTNVTIDISMAGFGLIVFGNVSMMRLLKFKIGMQRYPKKIALMFIILSLLPSIYFLNLIRDITEGKLDFSQSLWSQITVLCFSISFYFFAKHMNFIMDKGRVEASPILMSLFKSMPNNGIYEQAAIAANLWNKKSEKERAKIKFEERKKKKRKKKKRKH